MHPVSFELESPVQIWFSVDGRYRPASTRVVVSLIEMAIDFPIAVHSHLVEMVSNSVSERGASLADVLSGTDGACDDIHDPGGGAGQSLVNGETLFGDRATDSTAVGNSFACATL